MSRASSDAVVVALSEHYDSVGVTIVNDLSDLKLLVSLQPDLVFLGMKFVPLDVELGRDSPKVWIADYLDDHGIAYTGSNQRAHNLELDKSLAKQRVLDDGLSTSPFCVIGQNQQLAQEDVSLTFPLFVKPTDRGGGAGIDSDSVANNFYELKAKVRSIATELESDSLVEEYLPGREFSVAILKYQDSDDYAVMPIELVAPLDERGARLLSNKVKSANCEDVTAVTDKIIRSKITALAMGVFKALGARDYGRIDIRLGKNGEPNFLEANLIPSLISGYGSFPKACAMNINLNYEQMILQIAELGLIRAQEIEDDIVQSNILGIQPGLEASFS